MAAFNRKCGVDVHEISAAEVQRLFPLCKTDDVIAGFYVEDDGRVNPVDATSALARGAKRGGVRLVEGVQVTGVSRAQGRVTGVETSAGHMACEYFCQRGGDVGPAARRARGRLCAQPGGRAATAQCSPSPLSFTLPPALALARRPSTTTC